jgi:hypothetical protein
VLCAGEQQQRPADRLLADARAGELFDDACTRRLALFDFAFDQLERYQERERNECDRSDFQP